MKIKTFIQLIRPKHWLKNGLVLLPALFAGNILERNILLIGFFGFISFSFLASAVYTVNDICDAKHDRLHEKKKLRPLAMGELGTSTAVTCAVLLIAVCAVANVFAGAGTAAWVCLVVYLVLNLVYSFGLKHIPLVDLVILASGFVLRIVYGSVITGIPVSNWMYLVIISASFYMSLGKRRNEVAKSADIRPVFKYYNHSFLDKNMYVCFSLTVVFYSLWCIDSPVSGMLIWTVPVTLLILMRYSMITETRTSGDPVDVLMSDKILIFLTGAYMSMMFVFLYGKDLL